MIYTRSSFIIGLILLCQFAFAQFSFNLEAGTNYANLNWNPDFEFKNAKPAYGYYFAVMPSFGISQRLGINLEIQQSSEVYRFNEFFLTSSRFTYTRVIPQLEVMILNQLSLFVGYNIGYRVNERHQKTQVPFADPTVFTPKSKFDRGVLLGLRFAFGDFYFVAKYHQGLEKIASVTVFDDTGTLFTGQQIRSGLLQFGLGYRF